MWDGTVQADSSARNLRGAHSTDKGGYRKGRSRYHSNSQGTWGSILEFVRVVLLSLLAFLASAETLSGRVIGISDGDTVRQPIDCSPIHSKERGGGTLGSGEPNQWVDYDIRGSSPLGVFLTIQSANAMIGLGHRLCREFSHHCLYSIQFPASYSSSIRLRHWPNNTASAESWDPVDNSKRAV